MNLKSNSKLVVFIAIGFIIIWFLEFQRTSFLESYWLLLIGLGGLMAYQYIRLKNNVEETDKKGNKNQNNSK